MKKGDDAFNARAFTAMKAVDRLCKVSDSSLQLIDDGKHHRGHVHVQRRAISAAV